ncbi:MAG: sigma-70 family RNA polymerase sigma factor [Saprospiraceae bacterium]|nr:sigma-70 family RNA polymerase sigma factor [Saprospiraceae bacterium]
MPAIQYLHKTVTATNSLQADLPPPITVTRYTERSTDDELRQGCLDHHHLAQKYLYQRYFGRLLRIPMRYTGDRADAVEVLNHAFLKIFDAMASYQAIGSFAGWMARIVFHCSIDFVRRRTAYQKNMVLGEVLETPIDNEIVRDLESEALYALVQCLPAAARSVFSLYVVDGYKHAEIAKMLGIEEGTSKWHLSDARRRLKILLTQRPNLL